MATTSRTTYTHTCDLCGTAHPRHDLRRFGLVTISEGGPVSSRNPEIQGPPVDVCPACGNGRSPNCSPSWRSQGQTGRGPAVADNHTREAGLSGPARKFVGVMMSGCQGVGLGPVAGVDAA